MKLDFVLEFAPQDGKKPPGGENRPSGRFFDEQGALDERPVVNAPALEITVVKRRLEVSEFGAAVETGGDLDAVLGIEFQPAGEFPRNGNGEAEIAPRRSFFISGESRLHLHVQDIPVNFAAGRFVESSVKIDVRFGFQVAEFIGAEAAVFMGMEKRAAGGGRGEHARQGGSPLLHEIKKPAHA